MPQGPLTVVCLRNEIESLSLSLSLSTTDSTRVLWCSQPHFGFNGHRVRWSLSLIEKSVFCQAKPHSSFRTIRDGDDRSNEARSQVSQEEESTVVTRKVDSCLECIQRLYRLAWPSSLLHLSPSLDPSSLYWWREMFLSQSAILSGRSRHPAQNLLSKSYP
jgi:hypothetical protein